MSLTIRKATKADSKILLSLLEQARKYKLSLGDDSWGNHPYTEEDVQLRLDSNGCFVAKVDDTIIGSISLIWGDEHNWGESGLDNEAGYIHGLIVGDNYRGEN